jgi:hypothetical protein
MDLGDNNGLVKRESEYVSFEQANKLKELGFKIPCLRAYRVYRGKIRKNDKSPLMEMKVEYEPYTQFPLAEIEYFFYFDSSCTLAPEHWKALEWIDENMDIFIHIEKDFSKEYDKKYIPFINGKPLLEKESSNVFMRFKDKKTAISKALDVVLKIETKI